jgi:hypothetical protein
MKELGTFKRLRFSMIKFEKSWNKPSLFITNHLLIYKLLSKYNGRHFYIKEILSISVFRESIRR